MWVSYTAFFAFVAFNLVPVLQGATMRIKNLDNFYSQTLLKHDKKQIRNEGVKNELFGEELCGYIVRQNDLCYYCIARQTDLCYCIVRQDPIC